MLRKNVILWLVMLVLIWWPKTKKSATRRLFIMKGRLKPVLQRQIMWNMRMACRHREPAMKMSSAHTKTPLKTEFLKNLVRWLTKLGSKVKLWKRRTWSMSDMRRLLSASLT
ncbi:hypothetical protein BC829DRAFT_407377 [Chytridium lagenaria]|nr:hypothetical protein BC829DRAFT_407377 [Chytridium lagenaria]